MAKYQVGMYGGSFDPLHLGHLHDIIRAASMCAELYVMISWCEGRESTPKELRYRWILNSVRHLPNVRILLIEDKAQTKEEYNTDFFWEQGARDIREAIGKPLDIVFCGSDYLGTNRFESLYPAPCVVHYFDRKEVPISSTDIRAWASENWDYLPPVCRDYYAKKVLVVGGESTGKSTLVQNLALAYNTNFVQEIGRDTCEKAGGEEMMTSADLVENLIRQKDEAERAARCCNRLLFVDTDALTTGFYADLLLSEPQREEVRRLAEAVHATNQWDLVLFLESEDAEFIQDGTRNEEIRASRRQYEEMLRAWYDRSGVNYEMLGGDYRERFDAAKRLIAARLGIRTEWQVSQLGKRQ